MVAIDVVFLVIVTAVADWRLQLDVRLVDREVSSKSLAIQKMVHS